MPYTLIDQLTGIPRGRCLLLQLIERTCLGARHFSSCQPIWLLISLSMVERPSSHLLHYRAVVFAPSNSQTVASKQLADEGEMQNFKNNPMVFQGGHFLSKPLFMDGKMLC